MNLIGHVIKSCEEPEELYKRFDHVPTKFTSRKLFNIADNYLYL